MISIIAADFNAEDAKDAACRGGVRRTKTEGKLKSGGRNASCKSGKSSLTQSRKAAKKNMKE